MSKDLDTAVQDFKSALAGTPVGRAYIATCRWLLEPKPLNRVARIGLLAIVTAYVGGSIFLTFANL